MNFKFLFNNNSIDNRLMLGAHSDEFIKWANALQNGDPNALMSFDEYKAAQTLGSTGTTLTSGLTGAGGSQNTVVTTPTTLESGKILSSGTIKFNGVDTGYRYDKNLSAKLNRRLLKKTLKAKGLGDKADATGLISEYLNLQGGATGKDAVWLAKREGLYGYTTDANGNRDYHRTGNNWGRALATIAGGLVMGPTGAFIGNQLAKKNTPAGLTKGFYTPATTQKQSERVGSPVDATTNTETTAPPPAAEVKTPPTNYTFSGFNGDWGNRAQSVYSNNKDNKVWSTIDTDGDGDITLDEMMTYLRNNGLAADGKLGRKTLGAIGLGDLQGTYSWMSTKPKPKPNVNVGANAAMPVDDSTELPEGHLLRRPQEEQKTQTTYFYENLPSFVPGTQTTSGDTNGGNNGDTNDGNNTLTGSKSYYTSYGLEKDFDDLYMLRHGIKDSYSRAQSRKTPEYQQAMLLFKKLYDYNGFTLGNAYTLKDFKLQGGTLKYQQGGLMPDLDKMLLASTLGLIGYAQSQGKLIQLEEAVSLISLLVQSQPETLQELASNKELINIGIKVVGPEVVLKLSQPGVMSLLFTKSSNKSVKAMKGTKLNYIKELKGVCPEGYEMQYFAAGGNLCHRCMKKVEEAKCGKKMKKHEEGGLANGVSNTVKAITQDILNAKRMTKYKAPDGTLYENITPEDSAFLSKTVGKWSKNPSVSRKQLENLSKTDLARVRRLNAKVTESPTQ